MNNKICICTDFSTGLNDSFKNYNYPLLCPEESFAKLNGRKIFSLVGLVGYLPSNIGRKVGFETTINTHQGHLKIGEGGVGWKRLQKSYQIQTLDMERRRRNWCSLEKLNPCSTRYNLNERRKHQRISILINILTREKKYSSICSKK